jgi:alkaline phosphatase D
MTVPFPDGELQDAAEIGAVDDRGVRVWVRAPGAASVDAVLRVEGRAPVAVAIPVSAQSDWTGAATAILPAPAPGARFTCAVAGQVLGGRLAPSPGTPSGFTFAFGSCHQPFTIGRDGRILTHHGADIYPAMVEDLHRADARFLLLAGDQIYADALAPVSVTRERMGSAGDMLAAYRRVYRGFFAQRGFRALRASLPVYCMWDDHDIFNDWGSLLTESDTDRRLFTAATRAYVEYQQARNPGAARRPPFHYAFRHGDAGFLVLDLRGRRDYRAGRLLGAAQMRDALDWLTGDEARRLGTLFVVSSVPLAHVSRWFVRVFERFPGGRASAVRDRWCSSSFVGERDELLAALFAWQVGARCRQVVILSGDVHAAAAFTIRQRHGPGVIQQFTSSALTTRSGRFERAMNVIATRAPNLCEPGPRIQRRLVSLDNNYGLVRLSPLPEGGHRIRFTVRVWRQRQRRFRARGVVTEPLPT